MVPAVDEVRVVVVDDVSDVAEMLACTLEFDGYSVKTAADGAQALAVIEAYRPHCVLLDIDMPGMNGCELSDRLRQRYGDDLVLIAITGWGDPGDRVSDTFSRFDHYIRKPFDPALLRKILPPISA
ncbi:MAG TPA: response regulator [Burkholderiaceae bacterium]|jgi:CheY-like chemotaxis protein